MKIEIELSDDVKEQQTELRVIADRYDNVSDLEGIWSMCRNYLKHGGNAEEVIENIKSIAHRNYWE